MSNLIIANIGIRQDSEGRFSLNDLHKAAINDGANARTKEPSKFLASQQVQDLIEELTDTQNMGIAPINTVRGGLEQGTYVCRELVYAYAMWIKASFHLKVIRTFDAITTGKPTDPMKALNDPETMRGLLLSYSEKVISLQNENQELKPKAEALDRIATADGSICITNAAKDLQVRPKDLFQLLQSKKWIFRRQGSSTFTADQDKIQQGLLEHKITVISRSDGSEKQTEQVRITAKGITKLSEMLTVDSTG